MQLHEFLMTSIGPAFAGRTTSNPFVPLVSPATSGCSCSVGNPAALSMQKMHLSWQHINLLVVAAQWESSITGTTVSLTPFSATPSFAHSLRDCPLVVTGNGGVQIQAQGSVTNIGRVGNAFIGTNHGEYRFSMQNRFSLSYAYL